MKLEKDKIQHFGACLLVGLVASIIIAIISKGYWSASISGIMSGIAIGIGKEYGDSKAIGNWWDWRDILADAIGAVVGACIGALLVFAM